MLFNHVIITRNFRDYRRRSNRSAFRITFYNGTFALIKMQRNTVKQDALNGHVVRIKIRNDAAKCAAQTVRHAIGVDIVRIDRRNVKRKRLLLNARCNTFPFIRRNLLRVVKLGNGRRA